MLLSTMIGTTGFFLLSFQQKSIIARQITNMDDSELGRKPENEVLLHELKTIKKHLECDLYQQRGKLFFKTDKSDVISSLQEKSKSPSEIVPLTKVVNKRILWNQLVARKDMQ